MRFAVLVRPLALASRDAKRLALEVELDDFSLVTVREKQMLVARDA
jgi:hypothetical protein